MKTARACVVLAGGIGAMVAAVSIGHAASQGDPNEGLGVLDLAQAELRQDGGAVQLDVTTQAPWQTSALSTGYVCVQLIPPGAQSPRRRICFQPKRRSLRLVVRRVKPGRRKGAGHSIPAELSRPNGASVRARFVPADAGLSPGDWRWDVISAASAKACPPGSSSCADRIPDQGEADLRIAQPVGCQDSGPVFRAHGPRGQKKVALTFDDGPGTSTSGVLATLARFHARATFFVVGSQVAGRQGLLRRELREGDEIGNHTLSHAVVKGGGHHARGQIAAAQARIKDATGFTPCLFRAPEGAVSSALTGVAREEGLTTIQWDVDPRDWSTPGSGAIASRVLSHVHPGAIVVMHDGGGPRGQTVAALKRILPVLDARGYRAVTVSELLGFPPLLD